MNECIIIKNVNNEPCKKNCYIWKENFGWNYVKKESLLIDVCLIRSVRDQEFDVFIYL